MEIGFDIISDLNLVANDTFDWNNKPTSLYCILAGNISSDLQIVYQVLSHLSECYQGVFYVPGLLEYESSQDHNTRTKEIQDLVKNFKNVAFLYHNVVIIDGVAILGANGFSLEDKKNFNITHIRSRLEDIAYLNNSVKKLQTHLDVKKILVVTNSVPRIELYFGSHPVHLHKEVYPYTCITEDTENKISYWVFGSTDKKSDITIDNVKYANNPYKKDSPYWPKRINVIL